MARSLRIAIASALLLVAGNAAALGLGQIEVKSKRSQPLLAEIPIISTTPGELEALQARLASPETFRRIGLSPPDGIAADLQFSLGSDARGRPVIRVTTLLPVEQPVLNFLIEVDWGQGRLVREYSALVDVPRTAGAPLQPAIQAPVAAAPGVVQRPLQDAVPVVPAPAPVPEPAAAPLPLPATAAPPAVAAAEPDPAPASVAIPLPAPVADAPAPVPAAAPAHYGPVKAGETLGAIVRKLDLPGDFSLDQGLLALLRANPDAFLGDDINRLKRGAVLRVPGRSEIAAISADEAALVVRQQMQQWRQARRPVLQPDSTPATATAGAAAAAPAATTSRPAPAPAPQRTQARLEIVPPSAPGRTTATRSGTSAGGEGSMLQQELRQRDEDLAAKAAEIGELKERVAELERLRQQQQDLLAMKDSELAAVQQRLAEARTAGEAPPATAAAAVASTQAATTSATPQDASAGAMPWVWGGLALLGMAVLAWLLGRRQAPARPPARRGFDSDALAASLRASAQAAGAETADTSMRAPQDAAAVPAAHPGDAADTVPPRIETPAWHSARWAQAAPPVHPVESSGGAPRFVPLQDDHPAAAPSAVPDEGGDHRLKLALAFLDIGDDDSARQMLRELLHSSDPAARAEAARKLRELG